MTQVVARNVRTKRAPVSRASTRNTAQDLIDALGGVPAYRILIDPAPGTATRRDMIRLVEHEGRLVELVFGTLVEKPMGDYEDCVASAIGRELGNFVAPRKLGFVTGSQGMKQMTGGNVRMPDVGFTSFARCPIKLLKRITINPIAPDLIVEVLSPSNRAAEIVMKRVEAFASGTRLFWVVEPRKETWAIFTKPDAPDAVLDRSATLTGGKVLPGFRLKLEKFWSQFDVDE